MDSAEFRDAAAELQFMYAVQYFSLENFQQARFYFNRAYVNSMRNYIPFKANSEAVEIFCEGYTLYTMGCYTAANTKFQEALGRTNVTEVRRVISRYIRNVAEREATTTTQGWSAARNLVIILLRIITTIATESLSIGIILASILGRIIVATATKGWSIGSTVGINLARRIATTATEGWSIGSTVGIELARRIATTATKGWSIGSTAGINLARRIATTATEGWSIGSTAGINLTGRIATTATKGWSIGSTAGINLARRIATTATEGWSIGSTVGRNLTGRITTTVTERWSIGRNLARIIATVTQTIAPSDQQTLDRKLEDDASRLNSEGLKLHQEGKLMEDDNKIEMAIRQYVDAAAKINEAATIKNLDVFFNSYITIIDSLMRTAAYDQANEIITNARGHFRGAVAVESFTEIEKQIKDKIWSPNFLKQHLRKLEDSETQTIETAIDPVHNNSTIR
ncbi:unnamed protein product [Adineta steineri]|uniref:Uncharacterized protein n=1 Tax=Adineta steineri TaxID=433720 RepID=A0A814I5F0_9BILA|nr:unnamed protein product [Adineta steineri]CAF1019362.1 unnamed protein product [Adineta steineri]CAF3610831.1 unnamed protein product [Adineta steineri]